jgi:hypothetical protein
LFSARPNVLLAAVEEQAITFTALAVNALRLLSSPNAYTIRWQHEFVVSTIAQLEGFAWRILLDGTVQDTSRKLIESEAEALDDGATAGRA